MPGVSVASRRGSARTPGSSRLFGPAIGRRTLGMAVRGSIRTLQRVFTATAPNQKWAGDLTYVATREGWLYVAVLMDRSSRRIVGWAIDKRMTTALTSHALEMALQRRGQPTGLVHHSDPGSQYGAMGYQQRLLALNIQCSMSRPGNCWDHAVVESVFASLKTELIHQRSWLTRHEARAAIFEYLEVFYNRARRHSTLGYLGLAAFERRATQSMTVSTKMG